MRFTRAAKVAAFPLIVLALVALIACQGTVGPKGDKGDTGGAGTAGMDGDPGMDSTVPGPAGPAALAGLKVDAVMDNVDAGDDMDEAADMTVDLNDYFDGGAEPYTFSLKAMPSMDDFATAKLEGSMLTLKLAIPSGGSFNDDGSDGYTDGKSVTMDGDPGME
jgi:hypothetical protein